jgi:exopolysaccharide production protein ExoZ
MRELNGIQYLRALAALSVVGFHASEQFGGSFRLGAAGVDIFFVISGFIMWTTARDSRPGAFWLRRLIRVGPIYWFYTLLLVGLALAPGGLTARVTVTPEAVLKSLLFIPYDNGLTGIQPLLLQGWTLNFEMFFYLLFGLGLLLPRALRLWVLAGLLGLAVVAGTLRLSAGPLYLTYTDPILLEFLFGLGLAALLPRLPLPPALCAALIAAAAAAFVLETWTGWNGGPRVLAYGLPAAALIAGLVGLEPLIHRRPNRTLALIGDASYSLYLSHPFVLKGVAIGLSAAGLRASDSVPVALLFAVVATAAALVFAIASYRLLERPLGRVLGRALVGRGRSPVPATAREAAR